MPRFYTLMDGELRLYDGTATPFCYQVKFIMADPQIPAGRQRPEQRLIIDRNRASSAMRYSKGPDDVIFNPIEISFTARLDEKVNRNSLWQALTAGTVGIHNWITTKGSSQLESVTLPGFDRDTNLKTVNVEVLYTGATVNWGRKLKEVFFDPARITFGAADQDGITFSATGQVYGPITSMSSFTTPRTMSTGGAASK